jgi:hypothetical protein
MGGTTPETFANQMRMGVTVTDFTLIFGVGADAGTGPPMLIDKAIIHVAPGMLKQIAQNLAMAVAAYEEVLGKLESQNRWLHILQDSKRIWRRCFVTRWKARKCLMTDL